MINSKVYEGGHEMGVGNSIVLKISLRLMIGLVFLSNQLLPLRADVLMAAIGPMTGQFASLGAQLKMGAVQAVEDLNAQGGISGEKIVLLLGDDVCDPKQAVAVANHLAAKGIVFALGHFCSGSSIPASFIYTEERIIQITPAATSPKVTDDRPGPGVYRLAGRDDYQGLASGQFIAERFPDERVAIFHDKTAYGKGLADTTRLNMRKAGKSEFMYGSFNAGEKDYTALVSKLRYNDIGVLYLGTYHTEAGLIARQIRDQNMNTVLIGGDSLTTQEFWGVAREAGNGTFLTYLPDPVEGATADALLVLEKFRRKGLNPNGFALYAYAAVQVWAKAAEMAGSFEYDAMNSVLSSSEFDSVLGKVFFNENGDIQNMNYVIYEWRDGKYEYYATPGSFSGSAGLK